MIAPAGVAGVQPRARRRLRELHALGWVRAHKALSGALFIWAVVLLAAAFPRLFTSTNPNAQHLLAHLLPPGTSGHPLGTDELGEDVYARLVYGARVSVAVGFGAVAIGGTVGVLLGVVGGYFRRANSLVTALIDIKMALPGLLLTLAIVVMVGHSGIGILILALGITGWPSYARILRALVLSLREREFIVAARASGSGSARVLLAHVLPNVSGTIAVLAVLDLSRVVLAEAALSFLGLGIEPPEVSWGLMLGAAEDYIYNAWWLVTFPGVAIGLVVLAANVVANSVRGASDTARRRTLRDV